MVARISSGSRNPIWSKTGNLENFALKIKFSRALFFSTVNSDFKRQMLSTRLPKLFHFNVFGRIGAKVKPMLPLEREPFWRPFRSPQNVLKTLFKNTLREKHTFFGWKWFPVPHRVLYFGILSCANQKRLEQCKGLNYLVFHQYFNLFALNLGILYFVARY